MNSYLYCLLYDVYNTIKNVTEIDGFDLVPLVFWFFCILEVIFCTVQRITIEQIRNDEWFNKDYVPVRLLEYEDVNLDDLNAVFDDDEVGKAFKCYIFFPSRLHLLTF